MVWKRPFVTDTQNIDKSLVPSTIRQLVEAAMNTDLVVITTLVDSPTKMFH